jgi:hypothetical protein
MSGARPQISVHRVGRNDCFWRKADIRLAETERPLSFKADIGLRGSIHERFALYLDPRYSLYHLLRRWQRLLAPALTSIKAGRARALIVALRCIVKAARVAQPHIQEYLA